MSFLMRKGQSKSEVARLLGVTEGAVRYHAKRKAAGAVDGRSHQKSKAEPFAGPIADWHGQHKEAGVSLPALYAWLRDEHGFEGSLRAVQRYYKQIFPAPAIRARRRVETVIGAQAQVDWAEFPVVPLGNEIVDLSALVVTLSWSRKRAVNRVLFMKNCEAIANHPRGTEALIIIDEAHFEGHGGGLVLPPLPLGRMGRRLQESARLPVQQRSIEIYAQLAEVAR